MSIFNPESNESNNTLLDETAVDNGDPIFTEAELERMSHTMLRRLAAEASTSEINGKSNKLLITLYFKGQKSLDEFSD